MGALGNMQSFGKNPVQFLNTIFVPETPVLRRFLGPKPFVFVFSPEGAERILIERPDIYAQNRMVFDRIQPITGKKGLVQLEGEESVRERRRVRTLFGAQALDRASEIAESYTHDLFPLLDSLADSNGEVEVSELMTELVLRTAFKIFLDIDLNKEGKEVADIFLELNKLCGDRMRRLLVSPLFVPTAKNRRILQLEKELRQSVTALGKKNKNTSGQTLASLYGDQLNFVDQATTFLFAGHETTASSLAFSLGLLSRHSNWSELVALDPHRPFSPDSATTAVYKESLRLYPPAYMLARQATKQDEIDGIKVQRGDAVIVGTREIHRNPNEWSDPTEFSPTRFLQKTPLRHRCAFIPFGIGGKSCVGERLAYVEAHTILRALNQRYEFRSRGGTIEVDPLVTLHPRNGISLSVTKRANHSNRNYHGYLN